MRARRFCSIGSPAAPVAVPAASSLHSIRSRRGRRGGYRPVRTVRAAASSANIAAPCRHRSWRRRVFAPSSDHAACCVAVLGGRLGRSPGMRVRVMPFRTLHLGINMLLLLSRQPILLCRVLFDLPLPFRRSSRSGIRSRNRSRGVRFLGARLPRLRVVTAPVVSVHYPCSVAAFPVVLAPDQDAAVVHHVGSGQPVLVNPERAGHRLQL